MLTIEIIHTAKGRNVTLPKTLNHSTGKISNQQTGFNDVTWGPTTCKYVKSISKVYKKKPEKFNKIIACAKEFSKKSHHANESLFALHDILSYSLMNSCLFVKAGSILA